MLKMDLQQELIELKQRQQKELPRQVLEANEKLIKEISVSKVASRGLKAGDNLYSYKKDFNFVLPDTEGGLVEFAKIVEAGPVVLSFYRGGWCPYCNLEMKVLKAKSAAIRKLGAQMIAISPEVPSFYSNPDKEKPLGFYIASDSGNSTAKKLGISFEVPFYLFQAYKSVGIDLKKHQGLEKVELPIPATYVIDQTGNIAYAYVSEDFTQRASIVGILKALEKIEENS